MPPPGPLAPLVADQGIAILDGGLATELERRGHDLRDALWSARLLEDDPAAIASLHADYLRAGADCIVTASYQATVEGFRRRGLSDVRAAELLIRSVELGRAARDGFWSIDSQRPGRRRPLVAASIGPYGAFLADGSEYRGDYDLGARELERFHRPRWRILASAGADLLACESIPSATEARVLADLLAATPSTWAWLSFTCRDGAHISDGSEIEPLAAELAGAPRLAAIGINCTAPHYLTELIGRLAAVTELPVVAYPNSGERWDATARRWLPAAGAPDLAAAAPAWKQAGARLVGGCCRTGPDDIRRLRQALLGI